MSSSGRLLLPGLGIVLEYIFCGQSQFVIAWLCTQSCLANMYRNVTKSYKVCMIIGVNRLF